MNDRRHFLKVSSAAVLAAALPAIGMTTAVPKMATRTIPGTNEELAVVGLGNARPFQEGDVETTGRLVDTLLEHGGGYIDTSGNARLTVGRVMAARNAADRLFLGTYLESGDPASMAEEIKAVQDAQGGGGLDLVLSSDPAGYLGRAGEFLKLKEQGIARYVGVARHNREFYPAMVAAIRDGLVDFVQLNYSLLETEAAEEVLPLARERGVAVIVNRPFVNGRYFPAVAGRPLPDWAAEFDCQSWAQFSLKFILAHPAVTCVITETSRPEHAADNLAAGSGRLPDADQQARMLELIREIA